MHKKIVLTVFIMAIAALAVIYIQNRYFTAPEERITAARVVVPQVGSNEVEEESEQEIGLNNVSPTVLPLKFNDTIGWTLNRHIDGHNDSISFVSYFNEFLVQ